MRTGELLRTASPRLVMGAATGGLVALASAGTALLVLTGTSAVAPPVASVPPLPADRPSSSARQGVVVVPTPQSRPGRQQSRSVDRSPAAAGPVLAFAVPEAPVPAALPAAASVPSAPDITPVGDAVPAPLPAAPAPVWRHLPGLRLGFLAWADRADYADRYHRAVEAERAEAEAEAERDEQHKSAALVRTAQNDEAAPQDSASHENAVPHKKAHQSKAHDKKAHHKKAHHKKAHHNKAGR